ncbi:MAG: hypothetical protein K8F52_13015 [Candidatus Scalindua rubra]|nr:hypothetical protein [Candidatus Scalindua rubra]
MKKIRVHVPERYIQSLNVSDLIVRGNERVRNEQDIHVTGRMDPVAIDDCRITI